MANICHTLKKTINNKSCTSISVAYLKNSLNITCILTLSNPIFLPTAYSPALIYFGWETQPREYNAQSPVHIKTLGLLRNRKSTTCAMCWPKSVLHEEKCRTGSNSGAGATKTCRTSSDIGAEQENHNVGRCPALDRKGLILI